MEYIRVPNLPEMDVKLAILDGRAGRDIEDNLLGHGVMAIRTKAHPSLYPAISSHPDTFLHHVGGNRMVYAPGTAEETLKQLEYYGFELIQGSTILTEKYPGNVAYNAARVGNYMIHNLKYSDRLLLHEIEKAGVEPVHVNQGYAKCSISVVDEKSIITADKGIAKAVEAKGIEALLIEPERNIVLTGLDIGFIGGSTGLIGKSKWAITGNINHLNSKQKIQEFLSSRSIDILCLSKGPVIDVGSIISII